MGDLPRLALITDRRVCSSLPDTISAALDAVPPRSCLVILREKDLLGRVLFALAERLRRITEGRALLSVNGRLDIALAVDADGVHLGNDAPSLADVKQRAPASMCFGTSAHTHDELGAAARSGADYALLSPIGDVPNKGSALGFESLRTASRAGLPIFALGGMAAGNARAARDAGAYGVAVIRAVFAAVDPAAACAALYAATYRL